MPTALIGCYLEHESYSRISSKHFHLITYSPIPTFGLFMKKVFSVVQRNDAAVFLCDHGLCAQIMPYDAIFAPAPATTRGMPTVISVDEKVWASYCRARIRVSVLFPRICDPRFLIACTFCYRFFPPYANIAFYDIFASIHTVM